MATVKSLRADDLSISPSSGKMIALWRRENARNVSFVTLYGGQLMLSTRSITPNYPVILSHRTAVSLETYPLLLCKWTLFVSWRSRWRLMPSFAFYSFTYMTFFVFFLSDISNPVSVRHGQQSATKQPQGSRAVHTQHGNNIYIVPLRTTLVCGNSVCKEQKSMCCWK